MRSSSNRVHGVKLAWSQTWPIVVLAAFLSCAIAPPVEARSLWLRLESSGGTFIEVQDNGPEDADPTEGFIFFNGSIDNFTKVQAKGFSKPVIGNDALGQLDLQVGSMTGAAGGTLTSTLTDTDFLPNAGTGNTSFTSKIGGTTGGTTTVQSYVDPSNARFGTDGAATTGLQGPFSGAFADTALGTVALTGPCSITMVAEASLGAGSSQSFDAEVQVVPPEEPPDGHGRVVPTGTTCQQYVDHVINGTGDDPSDDGDFADGGFNYSVRKGVIANVSDPGAAFYFTTFTAPAGDSFTVAVKQDAGALGSAYEMDITALQVGEVVGAAPNATCNTLVGTIKIGKGSTDPELTLSGFAGKQSILRFRIDPSSIKGEADPGGTYQLNFKTLVNGAEVDSDPDGVLVIGP